MSKIILVGQAPGSKGVGGGGPLAGAAGRRLSALAGLDHAEFLKRFERVNLIDEHPGKDGRGDAFDVREARTRADSLREGWRGRRAVLLGRGVAAAFRLVPDDYAWFQTLEVPPGLEVAVMPHPSGISHWWNDPRNVQAARDFLLRLQFLARPARNTGANKGGRRDQFTEEEVAAALVAGRGIHTWAASILAEETGLSCSHTTIANYVEKYPRLAAIMPEQKNRLCDVAEHNVVKSVEAGDMDTSRWLLRSQMANGRGYALQVNGKVHVSGQVDHRHAHLVADLGQVDVSKYSVEQLRAIEDFLGAMGAAATGTGGQELEPGGEPVPADGGREG